MKEILKILEQVEHRSPGGILDRLTIAETGIKSGEPCWGYLEHDSSGSMCRAQQK
jgi:hypothetical protein